jgi:3',5'-cyclic AMP phosphodiesterase CpdA
LAQQPDFVVFTGDLTHTTDDPKERRVRMTQVREHIAKLNVQTVHFMPGEHDASLDRGEAFQEFFGKTHYTFDHKGVHFVVLDNVSDPSASIGDEQLAWLATDLSDRPRNAPIVVLTHRPLFDMYPQWDWATRDGAKAIALLEPFEHVTVFYGHIHQEHHQMTGRIAHHAAKSLMFPLPAPGSQPKRTPIPWDASTPYRGLGWRDIEADASRAYYELKERSVQGA